MKCVVLSSVAILGQASMAQDFGNQRRRRLPVADIRGNTVTRITYVNGVRHIALPGEDSPVLSASSSGETLATTYTGLLRSEHSAVTGGASAATPQSAAAGSQDTPASVCDLCGHTIPAHQELVAIDGRNPPVRVCPVCRSLTELVDNVTLFEPFLSEQLRAQLQSQVDGVNLWLLRQAYQVQERRFAHQWLVSSQPEPEPSRNGQEAEADPTSRSSSDWWGPGDWQ